MAKTKSTILYVDDETNALKYFSRSFDKQYRVLTATSAEEGYELLNANAAEIGVLMSDHRMPGEKGLSMLQNALQDHPEITRILVTAYSDHAVAVDAINTGKIFQYVEKPWDIDALCKVLENAFRVHQIQKPCWQAKESQDILVNLIQNQRLPGWLTEMTFKRAKRKLNDIFEVCYLARALEDTKGNVSRAAQNSEINRRTIQRINKRLNFR